MFKNLTFLDKVSDVSFGQVHDLFFSGGYTTRPYRCRRAIAGHSGEGKP